MMAATANIKSKMTLNNEKTRSEIGSSQRKVAPKITKITSKPSTAKAMSLVGHLSAKPMSLVGQLSQLKDVILYPGNDGIEGMKSSKLGMGRETSRPGKLTANAKKQTNLSLSKNSSKSVGKNAVDGPGQPSKMFLMLLDSKAAIIQRWYRSIRKKAPSFIEEKHQLSSTLVNHKETVEDAVLKRRRAKAQAARDEILKELQAAANIIHSEKENCIISDDNSEGGECIQQHDDDVSDSEISTSHQISPVPIMTKDRDFTVDYEIQAVNNYYAESDAGLMQQELFNIAPAAEQESIRKPVPALPEAANEDLYQDDFEEFEDLGEIIEPVDCGNCTEMEDFVAIFTLEMCSNFRVQENCFIDAVKKISLPKEKSSSLESENQPQRKDKELPPPPPRKEFKRKSSPPASEVHSSTPPSTTLQEKTAKKIPSPRSVPKQNPTETIPDPTQESVTRILSFLKTVEQHPVQIQTPSQLMSPSMNSGGPTIFDDVKQKIISSQMELSQAQKTISFLQTQLTTLRESAKKDLEDHKKSARSQLALQRKEYETIVKRNLTFIDKVLEEKEGLSGKVIELTEKVTMLEKQFTQKTQLMEDTHTRNLQHQKEIWQSQEKIKRDKWIQDRTKQIKDQTVQALEPEIQHLIQTHKAQLRVKEEEFRTQLQKEKQVMSEMHQHQIDTLREKHISERQKACEEEREFARQRYSKQLEREDQEFQLQKRKQHQEYEQEKLKLVETHKDAMKDLERLYKREQERLQSQLEKIRKEHQDANDKLHKQHMQSQSDLHAQLSIEKEEWQTQFMKKTEAQLRQREKAFREQMIKERDQEIEVVIERLESESGSNQSDQSRRYRMEIDRLKSEAAQESKQLRDQHSMALDNLLTVKSQLSNMDNQLRDVQKQLLEKQHQLMAKDMLVQKQKQEIERLSVDESRLMEQLRGDFETDITKYKADLETSQVRFTKELNTRMSEIQELKHQLDNVTKEKEDTIKKVETQVRLALASKDQAISRLQDENQETQLKLSHLEHLMDQQRSELLGL